MFEEYAVNHALKHKRSLLYFMESNGFRYYSEEAVYVLAMPVYYSHNKQTDKLIPEFELRVQIYADTLDEVRIFVNRVNGCEFTEYYLRKYGYSNNAPLIQTIEQQVNKCLRSLCARKILFNTNSKNGE